MPQVRIVNGLQEVFVEEAYLEVVVGHLVCIVEQRPTLYPLLTERKQYLEVQCSLIYYNEVFDLFDEEDGFDRSRKVLDELVGALNAVSRDVSRAGEMLTTGYLNEMTQVCQRRSPGGQVEFKSPVSAKCILDVVGRMCHIYEKAQSRSTL